MKEPESYTEAEQKETDNKTAGRVASEARRNLNKAEHSQRNSYACGGRVAIFTIFSAYVYVGIWERRGKSEEWWHRVEQLEFKFPSVIAGTTAHPRNDPSGCAFRLSYPPGVLRYGQNGIDGTVAHDNHFNNGLYTHRTLSELVPRISKPVTPLFEKPQRFDSSAT
ncbi:MAG: hypothetical protein LQ340_001672 [Diploschistes diacapsis]|nr:MAG: hypothetical protein LQ340_001672 [Diploschistes diacapsis]